MKLFLIGSVCCGLAGGGQAAQVVATFRDIPVWCEVDVVVAGGSGAAAAAACAAAKGGARVALVAPRPYVGDDLCGQQHLWLEAGEVPESELARGLFPDGRVTTPFTVKSALDQALQQQGVRYLTGCYATDLLVDGQGRAAGVIMVNRSGSQAIKAKVVIDATREALLARQAGARFRPFVPGDKAFHFVVVGGTLQSGPGLAGRTLDLAYRNPGSGKNPDGNPVHEYAATVPLDDSGPAAFARAEQALRNRVCGADMQDCSEYAYCLPADTLLGNPPAEGGELGAFRPQGATRIYVLSAHADLAGKAQAALMRPLAFLAAGERVGAAAAIEAASVAPAAEVRLAGATPADGAPVTIGEPRNVVLPAGTAGVVRGGARALPVWGEYDVVVVGGGTAGAPAGIAAARSGARTLVVEYLDELGGVGTAGLIASYWYGMRAGFTKEIEEAIGGTNRWEAARKRGGWNVVQKSDWLRCELLKSKADVWFNSFGCGAVLEEGRVTGVVVATPFGRGVVRAKTVVDATGNADIADCAGAETQFGVAPGGMLSVQLAGYPKRNLGDNINNTCFTMVDDTSVLDVWHLMARSRTAPGGTNVPYDFSQLVDSRERRRIVADYMLTTPDILNHRSFPDTISHHRSNFDAAAFPTSPMLLIKDMKGPAFEADLPYRSLLPKGIDGLLAVGLGAGAERDAMTLVRMQADLQNQGYAAGVAAAMAAAKGGHTREIAVKELQQRLVDKGVLAPRVLTDKDSCPMSAEAMAKAVETVGAMGREIQQSRTVADPTIFSLAVVMAHPDASLPLLRKAHEAVAGERRLTYAKILGILGDRTGAPTLAAAVAGAKAWDKGYGLTTHRESDNTFSELDRLVLSLGYSGAPEGVPVLAAKIGQLTPQSEMSHFIAAAMALQHCVRAAAAAEPLARLLKEPGFAGHAMVDAVDRQSGKVAPRDEATTQPDTKLNAAFKELLVAGMLVRCGDREGAGRRILEQYCDGVEGHFVRYARSELEAAKAPAAR